MGLQDRDYHREKYQKAQNRLNYWLGTLGKIAQE